MILITGATGHLGGAAAEHLLNHLSSDAFVVFARDPQKAKKYSDLGVEVRIGDFDDKDSLDKAMIGISKILLIPTIVPHRLEQNKRVIDAAVKNHVKHIVYTGISSKDIASSVVNGLDTHFKTEAYIRESGLVYTFLRNNLYMEALPLYGGEQVFENGFRLPAGNGKVPFALRREMGEAAANVLMQDSHGNQTYEIAGDTLYSYDDVAYALSRISGKTVTYTPVNDNSFCQLMKSAGVDEFTAYIVTAFNLDIKNGQFETVTHDLQRLLGRKPVGLEAGISEVFGIPV